MSSKLYLLQVYNENNCLLRFYNKQRTIILNMNFSLNFSVYLIVKSSIKAEGGKSI